MMALAILGILVNGAAVLQLKKGSSLNERSVRLHLLEDVLGWVAVLIGSILMYFMKIPWLDPLLSLAIGVFILWNVFRNLRDSFKVLLQGVPKDFDEPTLRKRLYKISEIKDIHDLHIWSVDGEFHILTMHLVVTDHLTIERVESIKDEVRMELKKMSIEHATIEIESESEVCRITEDRKTPDQ